MSNTAQAEGYRDRLIRLEDDRRCISDEIKDMAVEMKAAGMSKTEIAGIKLAVRRHFEEPEHRAARETAEAFAAALGPFADSPLGNAAIDRRRAA